MNALTEVWTVPEIAERYDITPRAVINAIGRHDMVERGVARRAGREGQRGTWLVLKAAIIDVWGRTDND